MKETIARLEQLLHTCVYGDTMRDRGEAYDKLKNTIVILNETIEKRVWSGNLSNPDGRLEFVNTYHDFAYHFNELSKMSFDVSDYYSQVTRCRELLHSLDMMLQD